MLRSGGQLSRQREQLVGSSEEEVSMACFKNKTRPSGWKRSRTRGREGADHAGC